MAAFRSLTADRQPLIDFEKASTARASKSGDAQNRGSRDELDLHLFEWSESSQDGVEVSGVGSVSALETRTPATVRVM